MKIFAALIVAFFMIGFMFPRLSSRHLVLGLAGISLVTAVGYFFFKLI